MSPRAAPFPAAMGASLGRAAPAVRRHLAMAGGAARFTGVVTDVRVPTHPLARLFARVVRMDGIPTDREVGFVLENVLLPGVDRPLMLWRRSMVSSPSSPSEGEFRLEALGLMTHDPATGDLVDAVGPGNLVEVRLAPRLDGRAVRTESRGQALRLGPLRIPLPDWLVGTAAIHEWEEPDGRVGISLTLSHPWLGEYSSYTALLTREEPA